MWTSAVLVLGILVVQLVMLGVLLLPLPACLAGPLTRLLKQMNMYALFTFVVLMTFLLADSSIGLYHYQTRETPEDHLSKMQHQLNTFRAQRNFYLTLFAYIIMAIIFRVRQLVSTIAKLKDQLDAKKAQ